MEYNSSKRTTDGDNMDGSQKHYSKYKKPDTKEYILYNFTYVKL